MLQIDFVHFAEPRELREVLRGLPDGSKVLSVYGRGQEHWAWVQYPDVATKTVEPSLFPELVTAGHVGPANDKNKNRRK